MKVIPLVITALGPLAFPERKPGVQFRTSLPYIPGGAIYGALGAVLGPQLPEAGFAPLFRQIRCHNAYPTRAGDQWVHPLPMTALRPKGSEEHHDSLCARVCWEQQQPAGLIYTPTDDDGRPWEAVGRKFYTYNSSRELRTREVSQRVLTRVAINRQRGTAEDRRLYSPLVISEVMEDDGHAPVQTRFRGSIVVPDDDHQVVAALKEITHLGGRQTTGIGAVEIVSHDAVQEDSVASLHARVARLNQRFTAQASVYEALGGKPLEPGTIFTINLLSHAILLDQGWLPTNEFSSAMLRDATGIKAQLLRAFTATQVIGGWNVSWQRAKHTQVATNMGSVFVFQTSGELSPDDYHKLELLERDGIGERRAEGYGHIQICDPFHTLPEEAL